LTITAEKKTRDTFSEHLLRRRYNFGQNHQSVIDRNQ